MGLTITEKIIARHAGKEYVQPGEIVSVDVDKVFVHDIFASTVIEEFGKLESEVWDPKKIIFIIDHDLPSTSEHSGAIYQKMVDFAKKNKIENFYYGEGVCHQVIPEQGHVLPGEIFIGTDSHTVTYGALNSLATGVGSTEMAAIWKTGKIWLKVPETVRFVLKGHLPTNVYSKDIVLYVLGKMKSDGCVYKSIEFSGPGISELSMDARFTIANMSVEMGAKNCIFPFDATTKEYMSDRTRSDYTIYSNDDNAKFSAVYDIDLDTIKPQVSGPKSVDDVKNLEEIEGLVIHQGFIGSCTNGRLEDLRIAANILKNRKVAPYVKLIVSPASKKVYLDAMKEGLLEIFIQAGAVVTNPTCGLCYGKHGGVIGKNEVAICSNNRNFPGRLGHKDGKIYLASPAAVAVSVLNGKITDPSKFRA
jgi:3-isopropylmalate/(R)-2-methylmalate dehydratase large subunit